MNDILRFEEPVVTNNSIVDESHINSVDSVHEPNTDVLLDRDGQPVQGVGRLDQVIGVEAADEFFRERHERAIYLYSRAVRRWGSFSTRSSAIGYRPNRTT